ncbi:MAG: TetR/AcrR family transcriptional regulator [bacterium]|nr:TetR/AcrR family transcriptional regulator [bacterium]
MTTHELKDQRVLQILEAATELFAKHGFDCTSVDEISKKAGLSKGAIYWYFPSKEKILVALAEQYEASDQQAVVSMASENQLGGKALWMAHRHLFESRAQNPFTDQLLHELISMSVKYPEIGEALDRNHQRWCEVIVELLEGGVERGDFKPFDTRMLSEAIAMLYRGSCTMKYDDPHRAVEVIEYATKLFYNAVTLTAAEDIKKTKEAVA